ncbi:MAG: hypothetical protein MUC74_09575 [Ideonella sp.]|jgi:hypothetical protein|nr:hypothetical protein [Ideonella sp.]
MTFTIAFWHLIGFLTPALGLGVIAASLVRLLWRRATRPIGWLRLAAVSVLACLLAGLAAMVVTGRDGTMAGYAAMVMACAAAQWWMLRRH